MRVRTYLFSGARIIPLFTSIGDFAVKEREAFFFHLTIPAYLLFYIEENRKDDERIE